MSDLEVYDIGNNAMVTLKDDIGVYIDENGKRNVFFLENGSLRAYYKEGYLVVGKDLFIKDGKEYRLSVRDGKADFSRIVFEQNYIGTDKKCDIENVAYVGYDGYIFPFIDCDRVRVRFDGERIREYKRKGLKFKEEYGSVLTEEELIDKLIENEFLYCVPSLFVSIYNGEDELGYKLRSIVNSIKNYGKGKIVKLELRSSGGCNENTRS